ncbi:MAG: glycyl-radical enzyme activating protein, partial [Thermodesulfobacteriota bacterium]|nr:glycyl-radical enzyme activating protein [Thermodesulfobacteriota bacterium]
PESQKSEPEILLDSERCTGCGRCVDVCSTGASVKTEKGVKINRKICIGCGKCVEACLNEARILAGEEMTVEETVEEVAKDSLFYRNSGGGITASGGEPLYQPTFLKNFLKSCQGKGLHTTLDTCGYAKADKLGVILEYVNLVLFDLKHMDTEVHKKFTGVSNRLILSNLKKIIAFGTPVLVRFPVIPGCNDSEKNVRETGQFIADIGLKEVSILPYHRMGMGKYAKLGRKYPLESEIKSPSESDIEGIKIIFSQYGLECTVGS